MNRHPGKEVAVKMGGTIQIEAGGWGGHFSHRGQEVTASVLSVTWDGDLE